MIATTSSSTPSSTAGITSLRRAGFIAQGMVEHECAQSPARCSMSPSLGAMPAPRNPSRMFETRSQAWKEVGLLRQISPRVVKRARVEALLLVPAFVGVVILFENRVSLLGPASPHEKPPSLGSLEAPVQILTVLVLVILGWALARDVGRAMGPPLFRRLDPATAGTVGFLIRLVTIVLALLVALRVLGIGAGELALGGAFTAGDGALSAHLTPPQVCARVG